jgi:RNA processing factor Prp31
MALSFVKNEDGSYTAVIDVAVSNLHNLHKEIEDVIRRLSEQKPVEPKNEQPEKPKEEPEEPPKGQNPPEQEPKPPEEPKPEKKRK